MKIQSFADKMPERRREKMSIVTARISLGKHMQDKRERTGAPKGMFGEISGNGVI